MTRLAGAAAALAGAVALAAVAVAAPAGAADEPLAVTADAGAYPSVRLTVAAPPSAADQVLPPSAFRVVEGGQARPVQVEALPAEQLQVALVLDTSGSMSGAPLAAAKAAAQSFLAQIPASVPVSVVGFGATASVVSPLSANRATQQAAIAGLTANGRTALYDGIGAGLAQLPAAPETRRVIVLLSDGGDTSSTNALEPTADALAGAKIPVFAVELRTVESNPAALETLASRTGGRVVAAGDPTALEGAFGAIAKQIVRQYAVTFRSSAHGPTDVDVTLTTPGGPSTVRTRLDFPPRAATAPVTAAGEEPAPFHLGRWAFAGGVALWGAAMLALLLGLVTGWTPKARGLNRRRRTLGLADAAERAESLGDTILRSRGGTEGLAERLDAAGLEIRVGELLMGVGATSLVALLAGWVLVSPVAGLVLAAVVLVGAGLVLDHLARRRRNAFGDQLADTLQMLAGSLRAGHSLAQGIDTVARESDSPTAEEFRRMTVETRLGRDFVEALAALRQRIGNEDFEWVVQAVEIQREVGGDLAEILDAVTGTIRDRTRVRRQVSALSAEGRLSAWVLMVLPFALVAIMAVTNRGYMSPLFTTGTGYGLLAAGGALLAVGGLWLRRIVKPTF